MSDFAGFENVKISGSDPRMRFRNPAKSDITLNLQYSSSYIYKKFSEGRNSQKRNFVT